MLRSVPWATGTPACHAWCVGACLAGARSVLHRFLGARCRCLAAWMSSALACCCLPTAQEGAELKPATGALHHLFSRGLARKLCHSGNVWGPAPSPPVGRARQGAGGPGAHCGLLLRWPLGPRPPLAEVGGRRGLVRWACLLLPWRRRHRLATGYSPRSVAGRQDWLLPCCGARPLRSVVLGVKMVGVVSSRGLPPGPRDLRWSKARVHAVWCC